MFLEFKAEKCKDQRSILYKYIAKMYLNCLWSLLLKINIQEGCVQHTVSHQGHHQGGHVLYITVFYRNVFCSWGHQAPWQTNEIDPLPNQTKDQSCPKLKEVS